MKFVKNKYLYLEKKSKRKSQNRGN